MATDTLVWAHFERDVLGRCLMQVLRGAPETVRELLTILGLQNYTLGLSLNGWDDLDYFR